MASGQAIAKSGFRERAANHNTHPNNIRDVEPVRRNLAAILIAAAATLANHPATAAAPVPQRLRCEYRAEPLGIDSPRPRLGWLIESPVRGQRQTAYHLLVAGTAETLSKDHGDLWDSGKVVSDRQHLIDYAGKPLESRMRCYWKVRIWDKDGNPSAWSQDATWTMGLLVPDDWRAQWIGAEATPRQPEPAADDHHGYHAAEAAREDEKKWVQVDLGKSVPIDRVVLHALNHGDGGIPIKGFGFPAPFPHRRLG